MIAQRIAESGTLRVCRSIRNEYEESRFCTGLVRLFRALGVKCRESVLMNFLCREGALAKSWGGSLTCRVLTFLVSFPGFLLHLLYRRFQKTFDESFLAGLILEAGDGAALMEGWLVLGLWIIPFSRWDNAYNLLGFLFVLGLLWLRQMRRGTPVRVDRAGVYLAIMAGAMCLAVFTSRYPELSGRFLRYHIICAVCVLATVSSVRSGGDMKRLAFAASGVILVSAVCGLIQRVQGVEIVAKYVDMSLNEGMPGRVQSYFDNPNTYAQVLVMLLPLAAGLMVGARRHLSRLAAAATLALGILAIGMTYSRSSWIGLVLEAGLFVILWKPKLIPPLIAAALLCLPLLPDTIMNRILTIGQAGQDSSVTSRFPLYQAGFRLIRTYPLTGVGLGTDAVREYIIDNNVYYSMIYYSHLHDVFLQVWAEAGLPAIFGFVGAVLWGLKSMVRVQNGPGSRTVKLLTAACFAAVTGSLLIGVVDYIWAYPRVMCIFWFVFALGLAGVRLLLEGEDKEELS